MRNLEKIVIMDWGGVIESHNDDEYGWFNRTTAIVKRLSNHENIILKKWGTFEIEGKIYNINQISETMMIEKWINYIIKEYSLECSKDEFIKVYQEEYKKIKYFKEVVEILHKTKEYCQIGVLTNLTKLDKERLDKQVNLSKLDYSWLSFVVGKVKPNDEIYKLVEDEIKLKPNNILFIDDDLKNIETAKNRGWNVLLTPGDNPVLIKDTIDRFISN